MISARMNDRSSPIVFRQETGRLGIQNPLDTAPRVHQVSLAATKHLTESLVDAQASFDLQLHTRTARTASQEAHRARIKDETIALTRRCRDNASMKSRDKRNCSNGAWLTVIPTTSNGTVLGQDEWRDSVRLRYNEAPQGMQSHCDGCNSAMTVEHTMSCKKGGLVTVQQLSSCHHARLLQLSGCHHARSLRMTIICHIPLCKITTTTTTHRGLIVLIPTHPTARE